MAAAITVTRKHLVYYGLSEHMFKYTQITNTEQACFDPSEPPLAPSDQQQSLKTKSSARVPAGGGAKLFCV